jgi:non-specific serine/threonine protein kinase
LATLVDASVVQRTEHPDGTSRYSMLEPIRQYASESLEQDPQAQIVRARHATFFRQLAAEAAPHLTSRDAAIWSDELEREHANLSATLYWCAKANDVVAGLDLVGDLRDFWFLRGFITEGIAHATVLLSLPEAAGPNTARARALTTRAWLSLWQGALRRAHEDLTKALTICLQTGERTLEPFTRNTLGIVSLFEQADSDLNTVRTIFEDALEAARAVGDTQTIARALSNLGDITVRQGDVAAGLQYYDESIAVSRASGDDDTLALALWSKAIDLLTMTGAPESRPLARESLALYRRLGVPWGVIQCLEYFAALAIEEGDFELGVRRYASAAVLSQQHGIIPIPVLEPTRQHDLRRARAQLGDARVDAVWAEQHATPIEQILDETLTDDALVQPPLSDASRAVQPGILSPRELEVLRLLVEGKSDREIAEQLFVSYRTITTHVRSILNKLGVDSRTAAATYAARHHLLDPT